MKKKPAIPYLDPCPLCGKGMIPMTDYLYCPSDGGGLHPGGAIVRWREGKREVTALMRNKA